MKTVAECRAISAELTTLSKREPNAERRRAYQTMAACWRGIAEEYERRSLTIQPLRTALPA